MITLTVDCGHLRIPTASKKYNEDQILQFYLHVPAKWPLKLTLLT